MVKTIFFYYKLLKSLGNASISVHVSLITVVFFQKTLFQSSSILAKILEGSAYFLTSNHKSHHKIGKINIVITVIIIHKIAYLIVFNAGVIFSSFHQESIINKPHHSINNIDKTQETRTNIEITSKTISQGSLVFDKIGLELDILFA